MLKSAATAGDAIPLIADALEKVQDPAKRAALEVALFGKTGQKLDTLLAGGSEAVNALRDAAADLGFVLSEEQIANADQAADKLSELKQVLEANIASAVANNVTAIYEFVTALENLIKKVPDVINAIAKFRDYVAIGQGVAYGALGKITFNRDAAAEGKSKADAAREDLLIRQNYGKKFFGDAARSSASKYAQNAIGGKGAGAGTSDAERKSTAIKSAADAKRLAAEQKRDAEKARRDEQAFQRDLSRAQVDQLDAQLDLTVDQTERVNIQQEILRREQEGQIQAIQNDEHLSDERKKQLILLVQRTGQLKNDLLHRDDVETVNRQALDTAQAQADNDIDILTAQANLARTAKERGEIERKILDQQFEMLKLVQQTALDEAIRKKDPDGEKAARDRLGTLDQLQTLGQVRVSRDNQGPLAAYLDGIPKTADEINEALEGIPAHGLDGLIDGLAQVKGGFKGLGDVVKSTVNEMIVSLVKLGLQRSLLALVGGGAGGLLGGLVGGLFGGARAKGGSVIGGKNYLVGEQGPELFTAPYSGNTISNRDMAAAGANSGVAVEVKLRDELLDARIVGGASRVTQAGIPQSTQQQSKHASRRLGR